MVEQTEPQAQARGGPSKESGTEQAKSSRTLADKPPVAPEPPVAPKQPVAHKRLLFALMIVLFLAVLVEIGVRLFTTTTDLGMPRVYRVILLPYRPDTEVVAAWCDRMSESNYVVRDAELGWTLAENGKLEAADYTGREVEFRTNAQAVRTQPDRVFDRALPAEKTRIVSVGDSFTHCDEVALADT